MKRSEQQKRELIVPQPSAGASIALTDETRNAATRNGATRNAETGNRATPSAPAPAWLQRVLVIVYVIVCFELGVMLIMLPWKDLWTQNSVLASYPTLRLWMNKPFVRGVVSGLGLLDLWIGISAAITYRDRR